jgi:hypothetical protein
MGVAAMGVAAMGVAAMGVAAMGVAAMGVAAMGVAAMGVAAMGVAAMGVEARWPWVAPPSRSNASQWSRWTQSPPSMQWLIREPVDAANGACQWASQWVQPVCGQTAQRGPCCGRCWPHAAVMLSCGGGCGLGQASVMAPAPFRLGRA